jgi:predicted MPP superfamily phosphohydrolase
LIRSTIFLTRNTVETLVPPDLATQSVSRQGMSRRRFFAATLLGCGGLALYAGEIERHWIDITHQDIRLQSLPSAFEGMRIVQLSDIHLDEFTEPYLLRYSIEQINRLQPDLVLLTGDYVSYEITPRKFSMKSAWQCAEMLSELKCPRRYAILGNHDHWLSGTEVARALRTYRIPVLINSYVPIEREGSRIWLAGLDDPVCGRPDPDNAIPVPIRGIEGEPLIVMCHAPDYVDTLAAHPAGKSVGLVLSGHTHGGQVRFPFVGALQLPPGGRKYVEGLFRLGSMLLYVNRGIGTVGVPFRFQCPPEITEFTLRADNMARV